MGLKKRSKVSAEFNMSSLTDIIFLLLIFFMLTSTLVSPSAINLKLPSSSREKTTSARQPLTVQVSEEGMYRINNNRIGAEQLEAELTQRVQSDGRPAEDITVILDIHQNVNAQIMVDVVTTVNDLGVNMVLATKGITPAE